MEGSPYGVGYLGSLPLQHISLHLPHAQSRGRLLTPSAGGTAATCSFQREDLHEELNTNTFLMVSKKNHNYPSHQNP